MKGPTHNQAQQKGVLKSARLFGKRYVAGGIQCTLK